MILVGGMCRIICCHMALVLTFIHLYSVFNLRLFLSILKKKKCDIEMPDWNGQWYQHLLTLFAIFFYESNAKGTEFWIMFICFTFVKCACFVLYSICHHYTSHHHYHHQCFTVYHHRTYRYRYRLLYYLNSEKLRARLSSIPPS